MSTNYEKLKALLRELFQMDQADLDFGIYRIMNAKRDEIERFLEHDLLPQVKAELARHTTLDSGAKKAELEETIENAKRLGVNPDTVPKVQQLRDELKHGSDLDGLENEVFSHLFNFFRRYYNEGDFLSLRRYKEGVYAIPYEGEEVKLYWANHDQYYIKSTEYLRNYTFKLRDNRRVHFEVVEADTETDNNKTQNGKERRFILVEAEPVTVENSELFIRFNYQADTRKQAELSTAAAAAVLGNTTLTEWLSALGELRPTEKNPQRTLLAKHLDDFTARYAFDYFIHKDLGGFLRRELDFFIKNELMHLDDVEEETAPKVGLYLSKIKALRKIAHKIIAFLEQLENFQKKLWLKKKFVVETNYCVTLDRVPEELYPQIIESNAQIEEWKRLFAIQEIERSTVSVGFTEPLSIEFLKANPYLVLDTGLYGEIFKQKLLSSSTILAGANSLADCFDGLLIHSENFHALALMQAGFLGRFKSIYTDPPYNTDAGPIAYKNGYRSASWMTMIHNRLRLSKELLQEDGVLCITIDDYQVHELAYLLDAIFDRANKLGVAVIRNNPSGRSTVRGFSVCHEYAFFYRKSEAAALARMPRTEKQLDRFTLENGVHVDWRNFRKDGGLVTHRAERPKQFYPIFVNPAKKTLRIPELSWNKDQRKWEELEQPQPDEIVVWPIDEKGKERVWSLNHLSARSSLSELEVRTGKDGNVQIYRRHLPSEGVLPRTWWDKNTYAAREYGSSALSDLFGGSSPFSFAKSPYAVQDSIWIAGLDDECEQCVLDFFGGSGTTAQAVITLNRGDEGSRKYVLIEMGDYFDSVLKPRIQKVVYSKDWKDGKPVSREGSSHCFKYIRLESYEDCLNNLELKRTQTQAELLTQAKDFREDYTLRYMLDVETRRSASLLNVQKFTDPLSYKLRVSTGTVGETKEVNVDLVETFNWLVGLKVRHIDHIRNVRVVEGTNPQGDRVLILWRNVAEVPNDKLDEWFKTQGYNTRDQEYDLIYVNGDNNLENLRRADQTWKVRLIEEDFHRLMWECKDV